ncbi:MAG: uridine kinase [Angustibacter sp.]
MTPERRAVLEELADAVPAPGAGRTVRVGVDGVDGAGKTVLADELAAVLQSRGRPVVRVGVDGFHHPRAVRYQRGRRSPEGFYRDSYDLEALRRHVLTPLGPEGDGWFVPAVHDVEHDQVLALERRRVPDGAVLVLDGLFLHRPELDVEWDLSVLVTAPFEVTFARMAVRDGCPPDPDHPDNERYVEGQRLYFAEVDPASRADVVVDNTDPGRPSLLHRTSPPPPRDRGGTLSP